ncbi:rho GTPase-activating protein 15-like isoform X9 [Biomphalaria glabrata]|uniref:Rho GTPase-activating protein 15-like isoform X9 n=1 Tax=Biomphalaria glabrata TaxID=6526 RepID=A0A9W2Z2B1_BIOGL|nr:rho GTPase-activating protein 15-like isoform X9 [Biomphalaria glabrata]
MADTDESEKVVKVLYDFNYADDGENIEIKAGDIYRLIEKTNAEWWQVYDPSDYDGESFFVPAQYVEIVSDDSHLKALSDLDKVLTFGDDIAPEDDNKKNKSALQELSKSKQNVSSNNLNNDSNCASVSTSKNDLDEGEYVNLDKFREVAGIHTEGKIGPPISASKPPQELIQGTIPPPLPSEGTYVKELLKGLPWDIYKEHTLGRHFYVNRETGERAWKPPRKEKASPDQRDVHWESQGHRMSTFGGLSMRANKAMSTYGQLETSSSVINRSSTLPANFMAARVQSPANERSRSPVTVQRPTNLSAPNISNVTILEPFINSDVLEGYVNKTKLTLTELGPKKKVKKNWSQTYLVLQGSNLIFYKDQKAAAQKQNSPHGKPEMVVTLQGAHVDFNPPKEYTSKKNTILLKSNSGIFLFHQDNEKTIREWFTRMKIVANDVSPITDSSPKELDDKKNVTRSVSTEETNTSISNVDKNKNMIGIRAKLLGLISRRPTQEDLYKRGIIKDAVFGSLLHELCDKEKTNVPKFVHLCIAAVERKGLKHDGLYRISGNMAEIQRLRCTVEKDENYNLYDDQWDIHVLTGALKLFFRELKEPVFPFNLYDRFTDAIKKESRKEKLGLFKSAVGDLPRCNYHTLKELFQHLTKVMEVWRENRMQTQNIAIVFGPTLMWQKEEGGSLAIQTVYQSKIVEFMLLEFNELFFQ